ncbi:MAG: hypothetical protein VX252_07335 [Myxococcota bacterium]|nr:hypothetical protein [Myxococcota bacterium]
MDESMPPERKTYLSRHTTFPIFSSDVGDGWLQLLNLALKIGTEKSTTEQKRFAEVQAPVVTLQAPLLEDGEQEANQETFADFLDFTQSEFDATHFPDWEKKITQHQNVAGLDDLYGTLEDTIQSGASALIPGPFDTLTQGNGAPGLISISFNTVEKRLFGSFVIHQLDLYADWPTHATALVRMQCQLAQRLNLEVGSSTFFIQSGQLHAHDWNRSNALLESHFKRPLPLHVDPSGVFLFGNDGGKARAMLLNHDASEIMWEEAFSDPEDLSWYIIDVMPWLLPQHMRYVGQECAALMRAMRESECYEQG